VGTVHLSNPVAAIPARKLTTESTEFHRAQPQRISE
jgi:hypothetical protein